MTGAGEDRRHCCTVQTGNPTVPDHEVTAALAPGQGIERRQCRPGRVHVDEGKPCRNVGELLTNADGGAGASGGTRKVEEDLVERENGGIRCHAGL